MGLSVFPETSQPIASGPVTLGYAELRANQTGIGTTWVDIAGLSVTVTVPAGRRLKVTVHAGLMNSQASTNQAGWYGIVEGETVLQHFNSGMLNVNGTYGDSAYGTATWVGTPSAGTHTYKVRAIFNNTGGIFLAQPTAPAILLVEDITGNPEPVSPASVPKGVLGWTTGGSTPGGINSATYVQFGNSVNVNVPAGRTLRVTGQYRMVPGAVGDVYRTLIRQDGVTIGDYSWAAPSPAGWGQTLPEISTIVSPSAGSHVYDMAVNRETGTGTASIQSMSYLVVEDVTPTPATTSSAPSSTLGYAQTTTNQTGITTTPLTNTAVTVTVPAGRRLRISGHADFTVSASGVRTQLYLIADGSNVQSSFLVSGGASVIESLTLEGIVTPSAGTHTYQLGLSVVSGTAATAVDASRPVWLLVEDITGVGVPVHDHAAAPTSTLAYAQSVTTQTGIVTATDVAGMSVTVTIPEGRRIRVSGQVYAQNNTANCGHAIQITENGAVVQQVSTREPAANEPAFYNPSVVRSPTAGTYTYKLRALVTGGGTGITVNSATAPNYILVEDITGVGVPGHTHSEMEDTGWIDVASFLNGWVNYGSGWQGARYRKKAGIVYVQGLIRSGTHGAAAFTLPAGFRPVALIMVAAPSGEPWTATRVDIDTVGNVKPGRPGDTWTGLNFSFPADA